MSACVDSALDDANQQLVNFLVHEEVARHVTAMYTLERIAAQDWAQVRPLMASINQVSPPPPPLPASPAPPPHLLTSLLLPAMMQALH